MSVFKYLISRKTCMWAFLMLLTYPQVWAEGEKEISVQQRAFSGLHQEFTRATDILNAAFDKCRLQKNPDLNFNAITQQFPPDLSRDQLAAALFLLQKRYSDKCTSEAVGSYVTKAADLTEVINTLQNTNSSAIPTARLDAIHQEIAKRQSVLFSNIPTYFQALLDYQTIKQTDRKQLESIPELQSGYDVIKLRDALDQTSR